MIEVSQILAVLAVLGLLWAALLVLRSKGLAAFPNRLPRPKGPRRMEVVERLSLGPAHSLELVRIDDQLFLVSIGPNSCSPITPLASSSPTGCN
jgi:flagellar biogenesis protein FliO